MIYLGLVIPYIAILGIAIFLLYRVFFSKAEFGVAVKIGVSVSVISCLASIIWGIYDVSISLSDFSMVGVMYWLLPYCGAVIGVVGYLIGWACVIFIQRLLVIFRIMNIPSPNKWSVRAALVIIFLSTMIIASITFRSFQIRSIHAVPDASFTNGIGMEMIKLSTGYYVSKYETRQSEFEKIMGYNPGSATFPDRPVGNLTADEAIEFCSKLTKFEKEKELLPDGYVYSLPTYKQWREYIADAGLEGSITAYNYPDNTWFTTQPVGSGEVNRLGIFDLRGNVSEYSIDLYSQDTELKRGVQVILGAFYNCSMKEYLLVENKSGFSKRRDKSGHVGFRCLLVEEN